MVNLRAGRGTREIVEAATAYDALAPRYENLLSENAVIAHSARVSLELVSQAMSDREFLLEVGSGIGRETLELAARGSRLVACDPSQESLRLLQARAIRRGVESRIETRAIPASRLRELVKEFGAHAFDGAFSSFALSYEPSLGTIPEDVWALLRPGAPFFCSIFNRLCLAELVTGAPLLVPRRGFGRLCGVINLSVDRLTVRARSYSNREVLKAFEGRFELAGMCGLPAVIPPHYLHRLLTASGGLRTAWEDLDRRVNSRWPFRLLGSHTGWLFVSRP
jgi:SAM-dependent methyltransferase